MHIARISTACLCFLGTVSALGQPSGTDRPAVSAATLAQARAILEPIAPKFPGLAVAVARDGEIVWSQGWGYADVERKMPATPDTPFRIYSAVKPMTAAALARLSADGRIDLDAPIQKYVPSYPQKPGPAITLRLLAAHRGGVRHYGKGEAVSRKSCAVPADAIAPFAADPLLFPPGSKEEYSSYGYVLVSAAIEAAATKPFEDAMRDVVFSPAGMKSTFFEWPERVVAGRALSYDEKGGGWKEFPGVDVTCKFGAGAFLSTANDMARFGSALIGGKIVAAGGVAGLFEPAAAEATFGFGWGVSKTDAGRHIGVMSGGNVGGRSALVVDPASKTVVAIAANYEGPRLTAEAKKILEIFAAAR